MYRFSALLFQDQSSWLKCRCSGSFVGNRGLISSLCLSFSQLWSSHSISDSGRLVGRVKLRKLVRQQRVTCCRCGGLLLLLSLNPLSSSCCYCCCRCCCLWSCSSSRCCCWSWSWVLYTKSIARSGSNYTLRVCNLSSSICRLFASTLTSAFRPTLRACSFVAATKKAASCAGRRQSRPTTLISWMSSVVVVCCYFLHCFRGHSLKRSVYFACYFTQRASKNAQLWLCSLLSGRLSQEHIESKKCPTKNERQRGKVCKKSAGSESMKIHSKKSSLLHYTKPLCNLSNWFL